MHTPKIRTTEMKKELNYLIISTMECSGTEYHAGDCIPNEDF